MVVTSRGYEAIAPIYFLEFNLRKDIFKDVRVRQAIAYALDRDFITGKLHKPPADFVSWYKHVAGWQHDMTMNNIYSWGDPMIGVHRLYRCDNQKHVVWTNTSGYCNTKLDEIMEKASTETDVAARKALYAEFQQILTEELPLIWTHEAPYQTVYHKESAECHNQRMGCGIPGNR